MFLFDWKLFGNGRGMASPHCDDVFYWLSGRFYRWGGGYGSQLHSIEWRVPLPGTRRRLFGHDFVVFQAHRKWMRVSVSWRIVAEIKDYEQIRELQSDLLSWGHGK